VFRFQARSRDMSLLPNVQAGYGFNPNFYSVSTGSKSCRGVKLATHPCLIARLRMSGAMPPLSRKLTNGSIQYTCLINFGLHRVNTRNSQAFVVKKNVHVTMRNLPVGTCRSDVLPRVGQVGSTVFQFYAD
jgi:hypothetical protein